MLLLHAYDANNYAEALVELRPLAEQGHAEAQFVLGQMYRQGNGVPIDGVEFFNWYSQSAEQGFVDAQYELGQILRRGEGVSQESPRAFHWYRIAARQGHSGAQFSLGAMYGRGDGVPRDKYLALMWVKIASLSEPNRYHLMLQKYTKLLTEAEILEVEVMIQLCLESNFRNCE